jgi:carbonic anhydrase/acetyltransferase-like protein (isoleucine patch superfamily)
MIKRFFKKLYKLYYTSSSERYIKYIKACGVKVGKGTVVLDPKKIQVDISRPELLEIGENVFLHRGTIILTHDWASWCFINTHNEFIPSHGNVKIGNNVWLGENVSILKGVTIGDNVIIGLGAVVTKDIPSNSIAVGVPAKVVSSYDEYFDKRKSVYVQEIVDYAKAIVASGRQPKPDDFFDDYPAFVDGRNWDKYDYPYKSVFDKEQFEKWKKCHRAPYNGFMDFITSILPSPNQ